MVSFVCILTKQETQLLHCNPTLLESSFLLIQSYAPSNENKNYLLHHTISLLYIKRENILERLTFGRLTIFSYTVPFFWTAPFSWLVRRCMRTSWNPSWPCAQVDCSKASWRCIIVWLRKITYCRSQNIILWVVQQCTKNRTSMKSFIHCSVLNSSKIRISTHMRGTVANYKA